MNEIEKTKQEIEVLTAKLELLKEMEKHKTPCEEAYKRVYGWYPPTTPSVSNYEDNRWSDFQNGYNSSKEDYKVGEYQPTPQKSEKEQRTKSPVEECYKDWWGQYPETGTWDSFDDKRWQGFQAGYHFAYEEKVSQEPEEEPEELKTLYDVLRELDKPLFTDDVCSAVKRWISQYADNVMCGEYKKGYEYCLTVLEENLK